ncbi:KTSC domain-containing protein [Psychroflexus planctonicus]|uniref:KTSC domain-containing protein n=1 Tax=Psychroflexus planctonicus TaxID=1526575 RepID=A0ABQ1SGH1_9FLAO|nr:KTSC domain-containing protein [Psychroflexus planctonicus]GGE29416.1 KTSC domain-containing protein [Psychroflexus planctonicus]
MERQPVRSSNIVSVGYDSNSEILEAEFKDGSVYQYFDVPKDEYDSLRSASSHGIYFSKNIRDNYKFKKQ